MRCTPSGFFLLLTFAACSAAEGEPSVRPKTSSMSSSSTPSAASGPLVLELFTSQGCSSCPPADRLLSELVATGSAADRPVLPLSFHVDYWNDLGWTDPFSLPRWSARQQEYAAALGERGVYTPQVVIGGRAHVVGSDRRALFKAVAKAPPVRALNVDATWTASELRVRARGAAAGEELWLALWEDGLASEVKRGENRGSTLRHDHVVRRLVPLDQDGIAAIELDSSWKRLGGAVFAQRRSDRAILAAAQLPAAAAHASGGNRGAKASGDKRAVATTYETVR